MFCAYLGRIFVPSLRHILTIVMLCSILACQTHRIGFKTTPDAASVRVLNQQTGLYEHVGNTPFTIDGKASLPIAIQKSDLVAVALEKDGYVTEHFVVDLSSNPQIEIVSQLKPLTNLAGVFDQQNNRTAEDMGRKIQSVYRQVAAENLTQAYAEASKLTDVYPKSSLAWDIRGSVEVLMSKNGLAVGSYKKSLGLNPDNQETKDALLKIESKAQ